MFQMRAEMSSSFPFVRFDRGLAKIVSHTPEDVQPCNIQHNRVEWKVKKTKEILRGGKP